MQLPMKPAVTANDTYFNDSIFEAIEFAKQVPSKRVADTLEEISAALRTYIHFSNPSTAMLVATWIAMTYCFKEFYYSGYIAIRSDRPGSGKTRLLDLIGSFSNGNPSVVTNPTAAVLYRDVQKVFLIDEVDRLRAQDRQTHGAVLGILNAGFQRKGEVPRTEKDANGNFSVKHHSVYGPKAFAGLEKLEDSLADRCFHIVMEKASTRLPRISMRWYEETAQRIRKDLEQWFKENVQVVSLAYSNLPTELPILRRYDDRFQDISEPLIVIAASADAEYGTGPRILSLLLEALGATTGQRQPSTAIQLAAAIEPILREELGDKEEVFIPSARLMEKVQEAGLISVDSSQDLARVLTQIGLSTSRSNGKERGYDVSREMIEKMGTVSV
jgi:hypothetical protein